jgi:transcriptional regulator with XRE-family HTH domain
MSQRDLARESGVSLATITNLERGHTEPRFETVRKLAAALEVDPRVLFRGPRED